MGRIVPTGPDPVVTGCEAPCPDSTPPRQVVQSWLLLGAIAQLVERFHGMEEVRRSILLSSPSLTCMGAAARLAPIRAPGAACTPLSRDRSSRPVVIGCRREG